MLLGPVHSPVQNSLPLLSAQQQVSACPKAQFNCGDKVDLSAKKAAVKSQIQQQANAISSKVEAHEASHATLSGGQPSFDTSTIKVNFEDGSVLAVEFKSSGQVAIQAPAMPSMDANPSELNGALAKAGQLQAAALAPGAEASGQDLAVASRMAQLMGQLRNVLANKDAGKNKQETSVKAMKVDQSFSVMA
ncbi:MAG: hypothetical protein KTR14_01270 [Vampirovibrio sp.]|nr:hypothetical protein [Vampirovibrio sp.]